MPPELVAALVAALAALASFLRSEVELRRQRQRIDDAQRAAGADRRKKDPHVAGNGHGEMSDD